MLKGKAEFSVYNFDMFWKFCIMEENNCEFFHGRFVGYNDAYWWENVAEKASRVKVTGDKGTEKTFKINLFTCEVTEVVE